jgi:ribosomal-protein-alanine N-acetyltransferase
MSLSEDVGAPPSQGFKIFKMAEHDLLEVVEIEDHSGLSKWGWEGYFQELSQPNRAIMLVTKTEDPHTKLARVSGFVAARVDADELHINNIAVRSELRSTGIGGFLLDAALAEGTNIGASISVLEVRASNIPAIALYSSRQFREAGRRRNYYANPFEDAIVMKRSLGNRA